MADFVSSLVTFASDHRSLAYLLAFALAASESVPVFGALVPGTATIVALAALVPDGALAVWPLITATTAGAVAGDGLAYGIGHRCKDAARQIWPLRRNPALVDQGVAFIARHGGKAILIARFTPGVRAVVPLAAGILGMPGFRFYGVNALSALIWGPSHIAIGVAIGLSLVSFETTRGWIAALVGAVFAMVCLILWAAPRLTRQVSPRRTPTKRQEQNGE